MQGFLNKMGKTATAAANKAGNKAGEMLEVGKIKSKISSEKSDIAVAKKDIGEYCYGLFKDGKLEDATIKELCEKIEACYNTIDELEEEILKAKDDYRVKAEIDPTIED